MAPKKLSDSDRQDILTRYRQPEETTVTIASHYGVSTSTISRILKQNFSEEEYDALIQQKRSGTKLQPDQVELPGVEPEPGPAVSLAQEAPTKPEPPKLILKNKSRPTEPVDEAPPPKKILEPVKDRRRRSSTYEPLDGRSGDEPAQLELANLSADEDYAPAKQEIKEIEAELEKTELPVLQEEEDLDEDEDLEDDELDDLDDDDLDDDDLDDEGDLADESEPFAAVHIPVNERLRVLPLSEAPIPRTCYVVVDRSSELITRPLKDFADLGQIPEEEIQARTLPIFDNHRVAKRFMRRMQRVVKVPDGRVFQKVSPYLEAKGITRLLIDGRVYSI